MTYVKSQGVVHKTDQGDFVNDFSQDCFSLACTGALVVNTLPSDTNAQALGGTMCSYCAANRVIRQH